MVSDQLFPTAMTERTSQTGYELVDFGQLTGVACPCGSARRAFADVEDYPATIHVTEISTDAQFIITRV